MNRTGSVRNWASQIIATILPEALFRPGLPRMKEVEILVVDLPLTEAARTAALRTRRPIVVLFGADLGLQRRFSLPKAVGARADAAIALQLRQTLPSHGHGLIWRTEAVSRKGHKIDFEVYIFRQSQIDAVIAELRGLGADVTAVKIEGKITAPLWLDGAVAEKTLTNWKAFSVLCVTCVALATAILVELKRQDLADLIAIRSERVTELEELIIIQKKEIEKGRDGASGVLGDVTLFSGQARRLRVLTDLTEVLPDTVWISELSISGDQMFLSGFSTGEITEVISALQSQSWASEVRLNDAISFDIISGENRFSVGLKLVVDDPV